MKLKNLAAQSRIVVLLVAFAVSLSLISVQGLAEQKVEVEKTGHCPFVFITKRMTDVLDYCLYLFVLIVFI